MGELLSIGLVMIGFIMSALWRLYRIVTIGEPYRLNNRTMGWIDSTDIERIMPPPIARTIRNYYLLVSMLPISRNIYSMISYRAGVIRREYTKLIARLPRLGRRSRRHRYRSMPAGPGDTSRT